MARILNLGNPQTASRCLACHAVGNKESTMSDGVSCEACHGPAEKWLGPHTQRNSHAMSIQQGMIDTKDLMVRARVCLDCHTGAGDKTVAHDLIAAGHPDLVFELDTFTAAEPMHFRDPKPTAGNTLPRVRSVALGQSAAVAAAMRELQREATSSWPEFSQLECYQCHHDLRMDSWRQKRGYDGRKPGSLQVNPAHLDVLMVVASASGVGTGDLQSSITNLRDCVNERFSNGADVGGAAARLGRTADQLSGTFNRTDFTPEMARAMIRGLSSQAQSIADDGVNAAEQATMVLDSLLAALSGGGTNPEMAKLYDYLEHPSTYQPAVFAAELRRVAAQAH